MLGEDRGGGEVGLDLGVIQVLIALDYRAASAELDVRRHEQRDVGAGYNEDVDVLHPKEVVGTFLRDADDNRDLAVAVDHSGK